MAKIKLHIVLLLLSGLGLSFGLPFWNTGWLVWISLVPFLLALSIVKKQSSSFWIGYFVGLIYFGFTFVWFWDAYPLKALAIDNRFGALTLIAIAWLFTATGMAIFWGVVAGLFKKLEPQISWTALLIFPSVFTFFEYLRSFFLSLLWTAPGAVYGPHWTAGNLSYALSYSPLALFISSLVGIYGLTFLIVLVNVLIFLLLQRSQFKKAVILAMTILTSTFFPFYGPPLSDQDKINAAIIQTAIPSQPAQILSSKTWTGQPDYSAPEQLANFRKQLELLDKVSRQYPRTDLVVFPEGSNFFSSLSLFGNTQSLSRYFDKLFPSATIILDNIKTSEESFFKSKTVILDSKNGPVASYEKRLLTPGGEYVPRLFREVDKIIGLNSSTLQQVREFSPGDIAPSVISTADFSLRSLICSDISSPSLARARVVPDIFTVQASFGFANGSSLLIAQTKAMARFRAAENQRALVFSSNFGRSFMLSPQGKVVQETQKPGFEILTGELILNKSKTLYNKLGDGPTIVGSFGVLVTALFWTWRKRVIHS